MSRQFEPNVKDLLLEIERNKKFIQWYRILTNTLIDYVYSNGDGEHLIESLLAMNYTPRELVYDMEFDEADVSHIARLLGYGIESDL